MTFDPIAYIHEPNWQESRLGLDRIKQLLDGLGNPQDEVRMVHVAGTNGKGSICAMLATILQEAGYTTGLFTSPYILHFNDRIRVNGQDIPDEDLRQVTLDVKAVADTMEDHPTEFELMTAVAFLYFERQSCDIAVVEVGLGGRLDSTNVIDKPELCIITSISMDHTAVLGSTLEQIAGEKAGIMKVGVPVVTYPQQYGAKDVIEQKADELGCPLVLVDFDKLSGTPQCFDYKSRVDMKVGLAGSYQVRNAAVVIEAVCALREEGWNISEDALYDGLETTTWPGRFEVVAQQPTFIVDGGHNAQGASALVESLEASFPGCKPVFIIGVLADKDYPIMVEQLVPHASGFVCIEPPNPRALPAKKLADEIKRRGEQGADSAACSDPYIAQDIPDAVQQARKMAGTDGVVCAAGSLYSIADLMAALSTQNAL